MVPSRCLWDSRATVRPPIGRMPGPGPSSGFDKGLFAHAIAAHSTQVRLFCHRYAGDPDEEDDLVQATWVLVWEELSNYRGDGSHAGWIIRLARTVCLRFVEERKVFKAMESLVSSETSFPLSEEETFARQEQEDRWLSDILALPAASSHAR